MALLREETSADKVLIDADKTCSYGEVIKVLDAVKAANLNSVSLAVTKKDQ